MAKIIVIEDEDVVRSVIRRVLQRVGHEVRESARGDEALKLHKDSPADVIVTDLHMPGTPGLELIAELRKTSRVRILVVSGSGETEEDLAAAQRAGADAILGKPFSIDALQASVDGLVEAEDRRRSQGGSK